MPTKIDVRDSVHFRGRQWEVAAVRGRSLDLRRGGMFSAPETATAPASAVRFVSSPARRQFAPEPREKTSEEIIAGVYEQARREVDERRAAAEAYHAAHPLLTGYHEAGHVVVAHAYGCELVSAWADPSLDRRSQGATDYFGWGSGELADAEGAAIARRR